MTWDVEHEINIGLDLHVPYAQVVDLLGADPADVVSPAVSEVRHVIGVTSQALSAGVDWLVEGSEQSRLPMRWYVGGGSMLFPAMTAALVVIRGGGARSELRFVGQCRALFGGLGARDSVTFGALAERMGYAFLHAVARRVSERTSLNGTESSWAAGRAESGPVDAHSRRS
jgi:hypothetical protein